MERLKKYIVIKIEDTRGCLNAEERVNLARILEIIGDHRENCGKPRENSYLVLNEDQPYTEICWKILEMYMDQRDVINSLVKAVLPKERQ